MIKLNKNVKFTINLFILLILLSFYIFIYLQYKSWEEKRYLEIIPYGLNVSKVLYANNESWGFGPGGNETGVIAYELPAEDAIEIQKIGIAKFSKETGGFSDFGNWQQTPITLTDAWQGPRIGSEPIQNIQITKIANYLDRWGFSIPIDPKIESEIDYTISKPGSYYAYDRSGIIIVIPSIKKVIYAYAG